MVEGACTMRINRAYMVKDGVVDIGGYRFRMNEYNHDHDWFFYVGDYEEYIDCILARRRLIRKMKEEKER